MQAIESFSQDHAHKVSTPQITKHQAHPSIYGAISCTKKYLARIHKLKALR